MFLCSRLVTRARYSLSQAVHERVDQLPNSISYRVDMPVRRPAIAIVDRIECCEGSLLVWQNVTIPLPQPRRQLGSKSATLRCQLCIDDAQVRLLASIFADRRSL